MELIEERMKDWRAAYDDMLEYAADKREELLALQMEIEAIEAPYKERMAEIEERIKALALARAESVKAHGVAVGYRGGYERVSYNKDRVDAVLGVLRDIAPETAKTLEGARKSSFVKPSVSIKAVD